MEDITIQEREPNHELRRQRELRGWSRSRLARELHEMFPGIAVTDKDIARWETGKRRPSPYYREKLCLLFGKNADELGFVKTTKIMPASSREPALPIAEQNGLITLTREQATLLYDAFLQGGKDMAHFDPNKRESLLKLLKAAGIVSTATVAPQVLLNPEPWERLASSANNIDVSTMDSFEHLLATCWQLSNGSELPIAENVLPQFLPRVTQIAQQPGKQRARAAAIASQGLQLQSILVHHQLDIHAKIRLCQKAVSYGKLSKDHNIYTAALIQLAIAYQYAKQPDKALGAYQEALQYADVAPLLRARVLVEAAEAIAQFGQHKEALSHLDSGQISMPEKPEQDPTYLYADAGPFTLVLYRGLTYLDMGKGSEAYDAFSEVDRLLNVPERIRLEIINHQGRAAIMEGDLEKYTFCLEDGLAGATALKSKKRYDEALTIFQQQVPATWYQDGHLRDLTEQYHLNRLP